MNEKHKIYLEICDNIAKLSKCNKHKVGSLIVKDNHIITTGVNGTISGFDHCCENQLAIDHRHFSDLYTIHSEINNILLAAKHGIDISNSILYCNLEPCDNCVKHIIGAGIKEIYYSKKHKNNLESADSKYLFNKLGITVQFIPVH